MTQAVHWSKRAISVGPNSAAASPPFLPEEENSPTSQNILLACNQFNTEIVGVWLFEWLPW